MKLTQKKVKELIMCIKRERKESYCDFFNARRHHLDFIEKEDVEIIAKYNYIGGQLTAYQKILQIMQLKVK